MSKALRYRSLIGVVGCAAIGSAFACSTGDDTSLDAGGTPDASTGHPDATTSDAATNDAAPPSMDATSSADGGSDAPSYTYTLIDDMETTTHGPIELAGINPPLTPAYWYNFGATAMTDTATPPINTFTFTAITPTTTLNGKTSAHAAYQICGLHAQYDVCGVGFEFAQVPDPDAGLPEAGATTGDASARDGSADAAADGGDAGPSIPRVTVPFDISQYKGIVFWAKTTASDAGALDLKVQFPDTDTDPRGGVCNSVAASASGPTDFSQCYNSYAVHEMITGDWTMYTVLLSDLAIDPTFGFQGPNPWDGKMVYGINWQAQKNSDVDAGVVTTEFWVDDVYFIQ
jgi:hypothetical protein